MIDAPDFDNVTRAVSPGLPRRRLAALLGLGAAGFTAAGWHEIAGAAKNQNKKARKKSKKKCKKQKESCSDEVTTFCAQFGVNALDCQADLLPCCDKCDVSVGVICTINAFNSPT